MVSICLDFICSMVLDSADIGRPCTLPCACCWPIEASGSRAASRHHLTRQGMWALESTPRLPSPAMIGTALWTGMASERPSLIKSPHGYWLDAYRRDHQLRRGPGHTGGPGIGCLLRKPRHPNTCCRECRPRAVQRLIAINDSRAVQPKTTSLAPPSSPRTSRHGE